MIRIGILGDVFITWGGGIDFLRSVTDSLRYAPESIDLHVLLPIRGPRLAVRSALHQFIQLGKSPDQVTNGVNNNHITELITEVGSYSTVHRIDYGTQAVASVARRLKLQALVPAARPLPKGFPVPWVGYLNDFQHRYFPHYFSVSERSRRDAHCHRMLTGARSLIVNARAVASDIARFHPDHQARIFSLPFSAAPQAKWLSTRPRLARREVSVNGYFIVCNQFWKHKDHATLFDAFSLIAAEFPMINLVCTGATADYRDHDHFPSLVKKLTDQGLQTRVHILGMIPKIEQVDFLRDAIALIQPTLFEGGPGGGAVFDAISLGVPCLVSDIDVNRELDEPLVTFFSAQNASSLADKMRQALLGGHATRDTDMLLIERGNRRRQQCGVVLLEALRAAQ